MHCLALEHGLAIVLTIIAAVFVFGIFRDSMVNLLSKSNFRNIMEKQTLSGENKDYTDKINQIDKTGVLQYLVASYGDIRKILADEKDNKLGRIRPLIIRSLSILINNPHLVDIGIENNTDYSSAAIFAAYQKLYTENSTVQSELQTLLQGSTNNYFIANGGSMLNGNEYILHYDTDKIVTYNMKDNSPILSNQKQIPFETEIIAYKRIFGIN